MGNLNSASFFILLVLLTLKIAQAQNVGVGTATPASRLEVKGVMGGSLLDVKDYQDNSRLYINSAGNIGIGTLVPATSLHINKTDAVVVPGGSTAQRPVTPPAGSLRYNSDSKSLEYYDGAQWVSANMEQVPVGTIVPYAGPNIPAGWLVCDGNAVSRTTYQQLYSAVGTSWGSGDGSSTFNLPDLRGRFTRGIDGGTGRDPDAGSRSASNGGGNTGNLVGSVQGHAITNHTLSVSGNTSADGGHEHTWGGWWTTDNAAAVGSPYGDGSGNTYSDGYVGYWNNYFGSTANGAHSHGGSTGNPNSDSGVWIPFDDNFSDNNASGNSFSQGTSTQCGGGWNGRTTGGNFIGRFTQSCLSHTHTINQEGDHSHSTYLPNHRHWVQPRGTYGGGVHSHAVNLTANNISGAAISSESRPANVNVLYIIKATQTASVAITNVNIPAGVFGQTLRYDGANWLANGFLYNDGTKIGIGTTNPAQALSVAAGNLLVSSGYADVSGGYRYNGTSVLFGSDQDVYANVRVLQNNSTANQDGMYINYNSTGGGAADLRFYANGTTERMRIQASTGDVGIGTDNLQGSRLAVLGGANTGVANMTWTNSALEIRGNGGAANITFHRPNQYGANFGLDNDNWFSTQGWSGNTAGYTSLRTGNVVSSGYIATGGLGNAYSGVNGVNSIYYHSTTHDSWFPYPGNNANYFRGTTYAFNATWYDENNSAYYVDPASTTRLNALNLYSGAPTLLLEDSDEPDYFLHNNSDRLYFLHGDGGSWNGNRPLTLFQGNKVGINQESPNVALHVVGINTNGTILAAAGNAYTSDWPGGWGGGTAGYDFCIASMRYTGLNQRSDARLKNNIESLDPAKSLELIEQLRPVSYGYNDPRVARKVNYGFIAQEVQKILPEIVETGTDSMQTLGMSYIDLIPLLTNAVQEQQRQIDELKATNEKLQSSHSSSVSEERMAKLEAEIAYLKEALMRAEK